MNRNSVLAVVSLVASIVALVFVTAPQTKLFGDCAGGVCPTNLWTGNVATNSVSPISASFQNVYTNGAISAGGTGQYNQVAEILTASTTLPATTTLGAFGLTTSTATSSFSINANATTSFNVGVLAVGDPCSGSANTSTIFVDGCVVTAVSGGSASATFSYGNLTPAAYTDATSTVFRFVFAHLPY